MVQEVNQRVKSDFFREHPHRLVAMEECPEWYNNHHGNDYRQDGYCKLAKWMHVEPIPMWEIERICQW